MASNLRTLLLFLLTYFTMSSASAQFVPITMWKKKKAFFVQTMNLTRGNMGTGGLAGANAFCLNDLTSYDWKGKSEAGPLTAQRVKAFLCDSTTCENARPNTVYTFASSNLPQYGGATFTTDSAGRGPLNPNNWTAADHFGGAWYYWTGPRTSVDAYTWGTSPGAGSTCSNWTISTGGGNFGLGGEPNSSDNLRWNDTLDEPCNSTLALICMVHPE